MFENARAALRIIFRTDGELGKAGAVGAGVITLTPLLSLPLFIAIDEVNAGIATTVSAGIIAAAFGWASLNAERTRLRAISNKQSWIDQINREIADLKAADAPPVNMDKG